MRRRKMWIPKRLKETVVFTDGRILPKGMVVHQVEDVKAWVSPPTVDVDCGPFQFPCLCSVLEGIGGDHEVKPVELGNGSGDPESHCD